MLTPFQKKVLEVVKRIPKGNVTTYKAIAKKLGNPYTARAVGRALSQNPWLEQIPCHRVIKSNGEAGGYAKGMKKKIELLKEEKVPFFKHHKILKTSILHTL